MKLQIESNLQLRMRRETRKQRHHSTNPKFQQKINKHQGQLGISLLTKYKAAKSKVPRQGQPGNFPDVNGTEGIQEALITKHP